MFAALWVTCRTKEYVCSHPTTCFLPESCSRSSRHLLTYVDVYGLGSSIGYGLNDRGSISGRNMNLGISLPLHAEQHWRPLNLLSSWYQASSSSFEDKSAWA